jgi:hypothetical protein
VVGRAFSLDERGEADSRRVLLLDSSWEGEEEDGDGIAIRTATLIFGGKLEPSSVIEIFGEIVRERELASLSAGDDEEAELVFKNILARVSRERGVVVAVVETSAVGRFSSSSFPLGAEGLIGVVGAGTETDGDTRLVRLGVEPE